MHGDTIAIAGGVFPVAFRGMGSLIPLEHHLREFGRCARAGREIARSNLDEPIGQTQHAGNQQICRQETPFAWQAPSHSE
jgi:hypothetical protein